MFYESLCHIRNVTIRLMIFLWVPTVCVADEKEPDKSTRESEIVNTAIVENVAIDIVALDKVKIFPVSPDAQINRVIVGGGSGSVTGSSEKLVYSNTLGIRITQVSPHLLIADDLSLNAPAGCELSRFTFQVVGRANPAHIGGPFRVDYALYEFCPSTGGPVISGTQGFVEFADDYDDAIQQVEIVIPADQSISLLPNIWLGLTTSRDNVGIIMGALPLIGFSEDRIDFPGFACNVGIGGFPSFGHASFNSEVYVRDNCPDAFMGYHNKKSYKAGVNHGANVIITSNIELVVESCDMVGYEVGVRGPGLYTFELRKDNNGIRGEPIEGTRKLFVRNENNFRPQSFYFDPPIHLDKNVWITFKVNNGLGGWVSTESEATIGHTISGVFYAIVTCAGQPPVGACCDMYIKECVGGHDDGEACLKNEHCKHPGTCEAVCREVPKMNCSFPFRGSSLQPKWMQGFTCDPDPFPFPCGAAACCRPDDTCENLTKNECDEVEPVDDSRQWQIGKYCGEQFQKCPYIACLRREGDCVLAHSNPGCERPFCCTDVCNADSYCCEVEWDRFCAVEAMDICRLPPPNDDCFNPKEGHGAADINSDPIPIAYSKYASRNPSDPGFCCNNTNPDAKGHGTVWFKFIAEQQTATISTRENSNRNDDSLIQVFSVGDNTNEESTCNSLIPFACNDDVISGYQKTSLSEIQLTNLNPGDTYYVMVAGKNELKNYYVTYKSPGAPIKPPNDSCHDAEVIEDGLISYSMFNAGVDCPTDACDSYLTQDIWFDYTASCSGKLHVTTCVCDGTLPDVVMIYDGCDCPIDTNDVIMCKTHDNYCCQNPMIINVNKNQCLKIRYGKTLESRMYTSEGKFQLDCVQCDPGEVSWLDPQQGLVDARRPHPYLNCEPDNFCSIFLSSLEGIDTFSISSSSKSHSTCWEFHQSNMNFSLHPDYCCDRENNRIDDVLIDNNTTTIILVRKLTPGEITSFTYNDDKGGTTTGEFIALPGDVNGDRMVCVNDVHELLEIVKGLKQSVWGNFSADIDHSGSIHPADILQLIDLMNGAGAYAPWLNATVLTEDAQCPSQ